MLIETAGVVRNLCFLLDDQQKSVSTDACLALVNLSTEDEMIPNLVDSSAGVVKIMLKIITDPGHELADPACMFLANITRTTCGSEKVFEQLLPQFDRYIDIFCQEKYNTKGAKLHYLASVFSNISQIPTARRYILVLYNGDVYMI